MRRALLPAWPEQRSWNSPCLAERAPPPSELERLGLLAQCACGTAPSSVSALAQRSQASPRKSDRGL